MLVVINRLERNARSGVSVASVASFSPQKPSGRFSYRDDNNP